MLSAKSAGLGPSGPSPLGIDGFEEADSVASPLDAAGAVCTPRPASGPQPEVGPSPPHASLACGASPLCPLSAAPKSCLSKGFATDEAGAGWGNTTGGMDGAYGQYGYPGGAKGIPAGIAGGIAPMKPKGPGKADPMVVEACVASAFCWEGIDGKEGKTGIACPQGFCMPAKSGAGGSHCTPASTGIFACMLTWQVGLLGR
mmetsp:Transcript_16800/g.29488  ORF Transcript_16800/g.29488 Transcript_16800/m.29488 type:complete len:201 (+) Transcript_16800:360-962(+)